jgi:hypothetical protein
MTIIADREYRTMDKTGWGDGPWNDEADKLQWVDEATGLDCLIVRNHSGALCGYVGVSPSHPLHGKRYDDADVEVHGGLTFADRCDDDAPEDRGICHVPAPGRPKDVWWFGFDCHHFMDFGPGMAAREAALGMPPIPSSLGESYKTIGYVQRECARLAEQLVAATVEIPEEDGEQ